MKRILRPGTRLAAALGIAATLAAAASAGVLAQVEAGLWEVSRAGAAPLRQCLADPAELAQIEHRRPGCVGHLVGETAMTARIHYSCGGGEFGHSALTVLTPRSVRVETQGIFAGAPFKYVAQARRVGDCEAIKPAFNQRGL